MSTASRKLEVGAEVVTDYSGKMTAHRITDRIATRSSQSGTMFQVAPVVPKSGGGWIDADWFEPAEHTAPTHPSATARNEKD